MDGLASALRNCINLLEQNSDKEFYTVYDAISESHRGVPGLLEQMIEILDSCSIYGTIGTGTKAEVFWVTTKAYERAARLAAEQRKTI